MLLQVTETVGGGYGAALLQALIALGVVTLLAWLVLRTVSGRRGPSPGLGHVRVLERIPLDARRALYLVRVGSRVLLLGGGDGAAPSLLAELDPEDAQGLPQRRTAFDALLSRFARASHDSLPTDSTTPGEPAPSPTETSDGDTSSP